ncbi:Uncharacterised protein [Bordetella pertussis]|nr:Uncharacterised protein [Bordetella pertussis]CFP69054.1 Uncharacterised protein [Bordetella pertussis]CFU05356.1 Uncharacterised protein [Bordetella pertussis]CFV96670.1 Uncharacterised protein [Bordetella pertussis]CFW44503.1 Uncharacterised protein [Bordetella pertussis]
MAAGRDESGIGITTSISPRRMLRATLSARYSPMRRRASYTETPSISESGRAKYTYSKIHGTSCALSAHWRLVMRPSRSTNIASPGSTSRTKAKPLPSSATDSEAAIHSTPSSVSWRPMHSGRMPWGSRNASMP